MESYRSRERHNITLLGGVIPHPNATEVGCKSEQRQSRVRHTQGERRKTMDKKMLQATFREWKKAANADYAITNPTSLGDCSSCVNAALSRKYGKYSKGVFAAHWTSGMNKDGDLADPDYNMVYIQHDITEEQARLFYEVFGKNYNILPESYNPIFTFILFEKDAEVYRVSWKSDDQEKPFHDECVGIEETMRLVENRLKYRNLTVTVERLFV